MRPPTGFPHRPVPQGSEQLAHPRARRAEPASAEVVTPASSPADLALSAQYETVDDVVDDREGRGLAAGSRCPCRFGAPCRRQIEACGMTITSIVSGET